MSRRDDLAVGGQSWRVLRLFALAATVGMAWPVLAQNSPLGQQPSSPFQEKGTAPRTVTPNVETPQTHRDEIEVWAKDWQSKQVRPLERQTYYTILDARNVAEFDALAHYSLLILTVVTQSAEELPLKRVYLRMPDREVPVVKIASWRREVDQTLVTYRMFGPYREDGFYLFPLSAFLRVAQLQVDFAANRSGLPVLDLPAQVGPAWLRTLRNPDPLPDALPNVRALQEFIKRRTAGFPIPTAVPSPVPVARRPTPEPSPQSEDARKPTAIKDLFKK
jgi:hypothetical protein